MEYVIVTYPDSRGVLVDGNASGNTNETLMIEEGHHEFTLDGAADFTPASREVNVRNTTAQRPYDVSFAPAAGAAP